MAAVVGVTLAILILFLILVIALLIAYKKEKMCFKSKFNCFENAQTSVIFQFIRPVHQSGWDPEPAIFF